MHDQCVAHRVMYATQLDTCFEPIVANLYVHNTLQEPATSLS